MYMHKSEQMTTDAISVILVTHWSVDRRQCR